MAVTQIGRFLLVQNPSQGQVRKNSAQTKAPGAKPEAGGGRQGYTLGASVSQNAGTLLPRLVQIALHLSRHGRGCVGYFPN
jgi:hypothetical protein